MDKDTQQQMELNKQKISCKDSVPCDRYPLHKVTGSLDNCTYAICVTIIIILGIIIGGAVLIAKAMS